MNAREENQKNQQLRRKKMMRDAAFWTKIGGFVTWMNFENYCGKAARKELGAGRTVTARIKSPRAVAQTSLESRKSIDLSHNVPRFL